MPAVVYRVPAGDCPAVPSKHVLELSQSRQLILLFKKYKIISSWSIIISLSEIVAPYSICLLFITLSLPYESVLLKRPEALGITERKNTQCKSVQGLMDNIILLEYSNMLIS